MLVSIMIAGFGGQGVMLLGRLIGECAFEENLHVSFLPAYGPEQRGGTANCTVIVSDEEIAAPVAEELDILCAMNQPSFDKFIGKVKAGGTVYINKTLVNADKARERDVKIVEIDADNLAYQLGTVKVANIIMLAAFLATAKILNVDRAREVVLKKLGKKQELLELNRQAFQCGLEQAEKTS